MASRSNQPEPDPQLDRRPGDQAIRDFARLASEERAAALRAMSGRLAHQLRNPLAAIQAACNSLREELPDPDHRQRLELTLQQIDRALALISAEVQAVARPVERPGPVEPAAETAEIISLLRASDARARRLQLASVDAPPCSLRRTGFRVALYSLFNHLLQLSSDGTPLQGPIRIELHGTDERLEVRARVADQAAEAPQTNPVPTALTAVNAPDSIGLLIVERFARDAGGRLNRASADDGAALFSLQLACRHD